jgi:outer membrane PBP1 activator LpoA protein
MTASSIFPRRGQLATISITALLALLGACASPPPPPDSPGTSAASTRTTTRTSDDTLTLPASPHGAEFAAAETALKDLDWMTASLALAELSTVQLEGDDSAYLQYLRARISHRRGQHAQAMSQLKAIPRPGIHPAIEYRLRNFERALLDQQQDHLGSARLGVSIMAMAPAADQAGLKRSVWRDLERLDGTVLQQAITNATAPNWRAWLELATIARGDLGQQSARLPAWVAANPGHPANAPLPGGLEYISGASQPSGKVALLLPLSGRLAPAGKAVRDGFLASYYQSRSKGPSLGEILIMDSDRYASALEGYSEAVLQGAELVVGPLSKTSVTELAAHPARPVPVLALNQIDQLVNPAGSALVQLSLAPEDEATRLAELAFGRGARRALLLRPAGAWGDKMERALAARWSELGGEIASSVSYTGRDDYSSSIKSGLGLEASDTRKRRVRDMLATNVEFTPRRREDLDVVFMLSRNGPEARSVKPLLAFHYAGQLPVYAPSSVYNGTADARDADLNGINLVDLPWLLGSNPVLKARLDSAGGAQYSRLNALGADAFLLQSRFRQLQAGPDALIRGDTGLLSMNPRLQIVRELPPATFDGGVLVPR